MKLKAYAKLNLSLAITGTRPDGMHELDMLMQSISLADELTIRPAERTVLRCGGMAADESNTALRAARLFFEAAGRKGGAEITLKKHIPAQAGLGGGSSDAGAVLSALNRLYGMPLSMETMTARAVQIGADVPFFLHGGCMRAQGIGERLAPVQNECKFSYLLVKPEGGVPTGPAYAKYHELPAIMPDVGKAAKALACGDRAAYFAAAGNSLLPAGKALCPQVGAILREMKAYGADFSMMTGSGSCVFAVFSDAEKEAKAFAAFAERYPFCARAADTDRASMEEAE